MGACFCKLFSFLPSFCSSSSFSYTFLPPVLANITISLCTSSSSSPLAGRQAALSAGPHTACWRWWWSWPWPPPIVLPAQGCQYSATRYVGYSGNHLHGNSIHCTPVLVLPLPSSGSSSSFSSHAGGLHYLHVEKPNLGDKLEVQMTKPDYVRECTQYHCHSFNEPPWHVCDRVGNWWHTPAVGTSGFTSTSTTE